MKPFLEYLSTLLHLLGMVLFAGGHIWFGFLTAFAERRRDRDGQRFLTTTLPLMANVLGVGVLLLFGSGLLKLLLWGEAGLIFLPDPYGWILLSKLLLYMVIVSNGILIERRYLPAALQETAGVPSGNAPTAWYQVTLRARVNLLLVLVVMALGEALRYSRL